MYVRVKDKSTGHEFDVLKTDKRIGKEFELVKKKECPESPYPRRALHNPLPSTAKNAVAAKSEKKEG